MDASGLSDKLLRDIFLLSADPLAILDGEGRFILWNAAAEGLFGFAADEVVGMTPEDLFVPKGIPDDRDRVLAQVRSGNPARFETQRKRKDGSLVPVEISVTPIRGADGSIAARFSVYWDLTRRRLAEERLKKANRSLRMLSNCNQALLRMKDEEGLLQEICRIIGQEGGYPLVWVGYTEDDPAKTLRPVAHWGEGAKYLQSLRISWADDIWGQGPAGRSIRTGRPASSGNLRNDPLFMPWQSLARECGFSSCISFPLSNEKGVFGSLTIYSKEEDAFDEGEIGILAENSEDLAYGINAIRRERERENLIRRQGAMEDISRKLNESLDLDEVLTVIADSAQGLLRISVAAMFLVEESTAYLRVEMPGGGMTSFRPLSAGEGVIGKVARTGEMEFIPDLRNDRRWINAAWAEERGVNSLLAIPLRSDERVLGVLGLFSPGERRYTGDEIHLILSYVQYASIAIKNADAHSKLKAAYQDLARSQDLLVRSEKLSSIGTLAAGAAHEILNPANVISLHAQRMRWETEEGSKWRETAEVILRNVDRISRICDDLRRFSRDEKPQMVPCDPKDPLRNCLRMLERQLGLANVRVEEHLSEASEKVMGDPNQLEQVFFNLVRNAMDAMPQGGILRVSSRKVTEGETHWLECLVTDTGEGIPTESLSRIFDPFFTTKSAEKGTGLGLAVSYGIVEAHGGTIRAESEPDRGATFIVRLPMS